MGDMTEHTGQPEGLRERKRAATRATIEKTAIELALTHGYENVTVDMICAASGVSQRTFFNYFGSKEGVILRRAASMTDAEAASFIDDRTGDVVLDLVRMISKALIDGAPDPSLLESHFRVIASSPELLGKHMEWMAAQEQRLAELVRERFRLEGRSEDDSPDLADEAVMVVGLAMSALHFALQKQFGSDGVQPLSETIEHAAALIRRIAR